ncbi:hypothetical protein [Parahaliea mediterranea]|nr:hypothetical protein [Parahaliea mediterranea]
MAAYQQSRVWITASLFERNEDDGVYAGAKLDAPESAVSRGRGE